MRMYPFSLVKCACTILLMCGHTAFAYDDTHDHTVTTAQVEPSPQHAVAQHSEKHSSENPPTSIFSDPMRNRDNPLGTIQSPRIEQEKAYSPPPPTMGSQMGIVNTLNVPSLGYELDGDIKVFTLIAQPIHHEFTDGHPMDQSMIPLMNQFVGNMHNERPHTAQHGLVWGYNGSMPGPTIEVTEGDRIRVILINELPEPTSIHWHGLEIPNHQDGAGGVTEAPTPPGGQHVYEFTVHQNGTFMYHTGFNVMKQDALGLGGLFVVHPKDHTSRPDKEFAILLQEWTFAPGNPNPNISSMNFNWFTFNGKAAPSIDSLNIQQGDRIRIRFGNLSMQSHPIHIHGYSWKVVGTEGGPIPPSAQWPGSTINVPPGTTRDVEFIAWNPGSWRMHCHRLHHVMNAMADAPMGIMPHGGMFTLVHVTPTDPEAVWQHPSQQKRERP
ncbi:multicopper oxidase domain-containing protein [Nitrospira sp. M1]